MVTLSMPPLKRMPTLRALVSPLFEMSLFRMVTFLPVQSKSIPSMPLWEIWLSSMTTSSHPPVKLIPSCALWLMSVGSIVKPRML